MLYFMNFIKCGLPLRLLRLETIDKRDIKARAFSYVGTIKDGYSARNLCHVLTVKRCSIPVRTG
jgi:hypothetical protein